MLCSSRVGVVGDYLTVYLQSRPPVEFKGAIRNSYSRLSLDPKLVLSWRCNSLSALNFSRHDYLRLSTEKTAGSGEVVTEEASATPSLGGTPEPQPQLKPQPKPNEPQWDVLATSTMVEYFHTGNLGDVLSSSPWKVDVEDAHDNALDERGDEQGGTDPLFDPPPDELSVSLYSKSDPKTTLAVVTVPRWLSDGDVWEVRVPPRLLTFDIGAQGKNMLRVSDDVRPFDSDRRHSCRTFRMRCPGNVVLLVASP